MYADLTDAVVDHTKVRTYKPITGPWGTDLPFIAPAFQSENTIDLSRITEPKTAATFALTVAHIPYTTVKTFAGIIPYRVLTVKYQGQSFQFVAGSWDDTVQDCAILRCYAYHKCHGVFSFGQVGLLRISTPYVRNCGGDQGPPSVPRVTDTFEEKWNLNGISRYDRWSVEMQFPEGYAHVVAGSWSARLVALFLSERIAEVEAAMVLSGRSERLGKGVASEDGRDRSVWSNDSDDSVTACTSIVRTVTDVLC